FCSGGEEASVLFSGMFSCSHRFRLCDVLQEGLLIGFTLSVLPGLAAPFPDPAPPTVNAPSVAESALPVAIPGLTFHAPPKPLSPDALTAAWPRFLGPTDNAKSTETHLLERFPVEGPEKVWELEKGVSYTSPVVA